MNSLKPYVLAFLLALSITTLMAGTKQPVYLATGVSTVTTKKALNAKREAGAIGEINFVDIARPYNAAVSVKDNST